MPSIPDRSGPTMGLLPDTVVNNTPAYPYGYAPNNGFLVLTPAVTYSGTVAKTEVVFRGLKNFEVLLGVCEARKVFITNKRIVYEPTYGSATGRETAAYSPVPNYNEQQSYVYTIGIADANNITVTIQEASGQAVGTATLTHSGLFSGNPVLHFGFPTDAQLLNYGAYGPGYDVKLVTARTINPGPSAINLQPIVGTTAAEVGYWIGNLSVAHARLENCPCTFAVTGGADAAKFSVRGSNLHVAATLTAGVKTVQITATDRMGATYAQNVYVAVGTQAAPTNITLSNATVTAPATAVGNLTSTDADAGDVFTYTLVSGTGSTNNALFQITGAALAFKAASVANTYSVRIRSTDASGLYYEKAFTITAN